MPCHDPRNEIDNKNNELEVTRLSLRCQELTRLLCSVGRAYNGHEFVPDDVKRWWKEHREIDKGNGEPWK
jgi:hypothetical protein